MTSQPLWKLVRLDFNRSPVHFGETGIGLENTTERVHSDTLFSAWVSAYAKIFGKSAVEALFERFTEPVPPFRLSSSFIYQHHDSNGEQSCIYYLPKPIARPPNYPSEDLSFAKTYRKLIYLPLSVWQRWYQRGGFSTQDANTLAAYTKAPESIGDRDPLFAAGTFAYEDAFKINTLPKVSIDRSTRATNFYHTKFVQYAEQAGLYFLMSMSNHNTALLHELQAALLFLGEEGIGGERSSGAGRFTPSWHNLPKEWQSLFEAKDATHHSLISLFWAKPETQQFSQVEQALNEKAQSQTYYSLKPRGGWIASPAGHQMRRQVVSMMAEGSVLPASIFPGGPVGALADVTPARFNRHRIYRSGVSVSLPVALAL